MASLISFLSEHFHRMSARAASRQFSFNKGSEKKLRVWFYFSGETNKSHFRKYAWTHAIIPQGPPSFCSKPYHLSLSSRKINPRDYIYISTLSPTVWEELIGGLLKQEFLNFVHCDPVYWVDISLRKIF